MPLKVWIRIAAVRLSRFTLFRALFGIYYRAAWAAFSLTTRFLFPEAISLRLHRGYATREWEPAISDIDTVLKIREIQPEETARFTAKWGKFRTLMRIFFPILGETIITNGTEQRLYVSWGDIRSAASRPPAAPESSAMMAKTALSLWTECLHSHTQLCKIAVSKDIPPPAIAERTLRKCILDIIRHSAAFRRYPPLHPIKSRLETENSPDAHRDLTPPELLEIIQRIKAAGTDAAEIKRLSQLACAHTANILEQDAVSLTNRISWLTAPVPATFAPAAPEAEASAAAIYKLLRMRLGTFFDSAILDDVFASFIALRNIAGPAEDVACGISILDSMTAWHSSMQRTIFVLGRSSMTLMGLCAYGDDPLKMCFPRHTGPATDPVVHLKSGNAPPFSFHQRTFIFPPQAGYLAPAPPLLEMMYLESLSHFLRTWRNLLEAGAGGPIYAVSRAAALWLYFVKGIPQPCFPLQTLLAEFKRQRGPERDPHVFETGLLLGLQPRDMTLVAALNEETVKAAAAVSRGLEAAASL